MGRKTHALLSCPKYLINTFLCFLIKSSKKSTLTRAKFKNLEFDFHLIECKAIMNCVKFLTNTVKLFNMFLIFVKQKLSSGLL